MSITPSTTGYADVNGLHLYYETYGSGAPLVLLHGGMLTIDLNFASLIPTLARTHTVIGVERAAVLGHSMGGGVAVELAVNHPDRVSAIVPISASVSKDGMHPDLLDPSTFETSSIMPTAQEFADFKGAYERLSPHPEQFDAFLMSLSGMDSDFAGWTDEQLAGISCPVLIVQGDNDFTTVAHAGVMLAKIPNSTLAVIPATTHMQVTRRDTILLPVLEQFFAAHPGV